MNQFT